jgi:geranylgeranyl diphosphate synthase type II
MNPYFESLSQLINHSLLQGIDSRKGLLEQSIYYALSIKGKRLRPLLLLTLLESFGLSPRDYLDIACSIEYIHTYSLIHDDLPAMDNDDFRRGMPTLHKEFNEPIALLAGDTLLTMAFERIANSRLSDAKIVSICRILTNSIGLKGMAGGQARDLGFKGEKHTVFKIHRMKTADLIKATFLSAAEIADLSTFHKNRLQYAGILIGIAFQMADDMLDLEGDEKEVGKKLKKDLSNESPNSVIFYGREFIKGKIENLYARTCDQLDEIGIDFPPFRELIKMMVFRSK